MKMFKKILLLPLKFVRLISALPFVIIIRLLSPFLTIRLGMIDIGRIGGMYRGDLYLSEKDSRYHQGKYLDRFYGRKTTNHVNLQWIKMWKRELNFLFFPVLCESIERVNKIFPGYEKYKILPSYTLVPSREDYKKYVETKDPAIYAKFNQRLDSVLRTRQPNLSFTPEEIVLGDGCLQEIGIPSKASFICFHNRDSSFLDTVRDDYDWSYHDHRDSSIEKYLSAAEEMVKREYYAVRIGAITKEKINITSPKLIDYANNGMRTDFLDIYLSAKCRFILCSETGMSFPAEVFKRPLVYVNWTACLMLPVYALNALIIFKKFYLKNENRYMSFSEILNLEVEVKGTNEIFFSELGLELIENTSEEIRSVTIEMDERLNGTWETSEEDEELQQRFWALLGSDQLKSPDFLIGADYLRKNKDLLD